jgi:hypothetical protein
MAQQSAAAAVTLGPGLAVLPTLPGRWLGGSSPGSRRFPAACANTETNTGCDGHPWRIPAARPNALRGCCLGRPAQALSASAEEESRLLKLETPYSCWPGCTPTDPAHPQYTSRAQTLFRRQLLGARASRSSHASAAARRGSPRAISIVELHRAREPLPRHVLYQTSKPPLVSPLNDRLLPVVPCITAFQVSIEACRFAAHRACPHRVCPLETAAYCLRWTRAEHCAPMRVAESRWSAHNSSAQSTAAGA